MLGVATDVRASRSAAQRVVRFFKFVDVSYGGEKIFLGHLGADQLLISSLVLGVKPFD